MPALGVMFQSALHYSPLPKHSTQSLQIFTYCMKLCALLVCLMTLVELFSLYYRTFNFFGVFFFYSFSVKSFKNLKLVQKTNAFHLCSSLIIIINYGYRNYLQAVRKASRRPSILRKLHIQSV